MAASSASSFHFISLTTQMLSLSKPKITSSSSLSFPFSSLKLSSLSSSSSSSFKSFIDSRFARNVVLSSEFDPTEALVEEDDGVVGNVFDSEEDEGEETNNSPVDKIFVGNLPFNVDSAALAGLFQQAGSVEMVEVIYDKITGRSRGFGFVTMSTAHEAEAAAHQFNGYELEGRMLRVSSGPPPPKRERTTFRGDRSGSTNFSNTKVYVGNLSWGVDNAALETLFRQQGRVTEARVVYDRDSGRSRGFGFVTYSSADEVNSAIEALDGVDLDGRPIRVSPAEARQRRQFDY